MILGLTGSIGSGKTTVARMLQEWGGAVVIDADAIAYELQAPGGSAYNEILKAFGPDIVDGEGKIDRATLGAMVFSDPEKRKLLNSIVHPLVRTEELRLLDKYRSEPLVVFMVPLLYENGLESLVDRVLVVTVGDDARRQRLWERSQMPPEEISRRLAAQMPQEEKARRADFVINNGGTRDETEAQVKSLLASLRKSQAH
ncbi:MAG: dephospho-CoA kinase [Candidatus Sumerlaeaceae bacterium]|nr:dephospho-CoA kinase [Candidatus Sumerlaeaceae bacterium]